MVKLCLSHYTIVLTVRPSSVKFHEKLLFFRILGVAVHSIPVRKNLFALSVVFCFWQ